MGAYDLAGVDALNNTFTVNHYSSEDPDGKIQDFKEKFKAKYNQSPNAFNALGYDTVYLLKDAIERAGEVDSKKIKEELEKTDGLELITGLYSVDENHHPIKSATILEFQDGEQVFKTKVDP
ncbi:ABC transporter substrate-binding protein [Bacillus sp. Sa1BUA2]|uniref:ABC transporter substrate-binding protein n=1 Tax=Bacillus norwichensis TaxID=2762217 RepID=A0ABR8VSK6_9BACI|nr:ABC transporter substrate-binding protein [Bacillus norwichensis]